MPPFLRSIFLEAMLRQDLAPNQWMTVLHATQYYSASTHLSKHNTVIQHIIIEKTPALPFVTAIWTTKRRRQITRCA